MNISWRKGAGWSGVVALGLLMAIAASGPASGTGFRGAMVVKGSAGGASVTEGKSFGQYCDNSAGISSALVEKSGGSVTVSVIPSLLKCSGGLPGGTYQVIFYNRVSFVRDSGGFYRDFDWGGDECTHGDPGTTVIGSMVIDGKGSGSGTYSLTPAGTLVPNADGEAYAVCVSKVIHGIAAPVTVIA